MLDNFYDNIGGKIKNWAKWIFIVEAIGAVIVGIFMIANSLDIDDDLAIFGILTIILGPLVAWISSWLLYAFGKLVEDVHAIRNKEGTTEKVTADHGAEMEARQKAEATCEVEKNASSETIIKRKMNAWDHWNEEDSSFGQCGICKAKSLPLLFVEYEDSDGKHQKNICYNCFCERDCSPVEERK